jgi:VWFA-related protein
LNLRFSHQFLIFGSGALCALTAMALWAQEGGPESPIKVDVEVVNVLCTVYDRRGMLVTDLSREDFEVRENGRKEEIRYFSRETDLPLSVALLIDVSGSVQSFLQYEKEAAAHFLEAVLRPADQALLIGFSSTIVLWQDFTSSVDLLGRALERMKSVPFRGLPADGQPMPSTLLYDVVHRTAIDKLSDVAGRKAVILISDGVDNGSASHIQDAVAAAQTANAVVYSICYEGRFSGCSYLKSLAEPTGGRMFEAGKKTSVAEIFATIEQEMRSQYAIGYVPEDRARDGKFRKLQVKVLRKGLRVHTRKGYYAQK